LVLIAPVTVYFSTGPVGAGPVEPCAGETRTSPLQGQTWTVLVIVLVTVTSDHDANAMPLVASTTAAFIEYFMLIDVLDCNDRLVEKKLS
jgi:hypothetical protein